MSRPVAPDPTDTSHRIGPVELARALDLRDLTDPSGGPHAVQLVVDHLVRSLTDAWSVPARTDPGQRVVTVADNYDRLLYSAGAVTRDRRYTRYVGAGLMLRSHTSAGVPPLLRRIASDQDVDDVLLVLPGVCYRRDVIDRQHVAEPHQLDLWRIRLSGPPLTGADLDAMVGLVVDAVLPGRGRRTPPSTHPYTCEGREIYIDVDGVGTEVGECGLAHPEVLAAAGLPVGATGLAMGLGLDRLTMLVKGMDDIRLLRSQDPRVASQLTDLEPYQPVSHQPAARRDLSVAVPADLDEELLGDRVRELLGPQAGQVEAVEVLSDTAYEDLPASARDRMGMIPGMRNLLVRLVLRSLDRTLTAQDANDLRDRVYAGLHRGTAQEWATPGRGGTSTAGERGGCGP